MQFQIDAEKLVEIKNKIKRVVLNSSIVKKTIYLKVINDKLIMYAYSEGNYGEAHIPCMVKQDGFVELLDKSLDIFDFITGVASFELSGNQLIYYSPMAHGGINIVSDKPDFTERTVPAEWIALPKPSLNILYCITKDDNNLCNVFFMDDKMGTTAQVAFAGYKHPEVLVTTPFTVPMSFFDLIPGDVEIAFDAKRIWFKSGDFYVCAQTIDYTNPLVNEYSYYEFDTHDVSFFEITVDEAKRLCGYANAVSEGRVVALVLKNNALTIIPSGSELGVGTMAISCIASSGEMNFGASVRLLSNAFANVDGNSCKVYNPEPQGSSVLVIDGQMTRHMIMEIPNARMIL